MSAPRVGIISFAHESNTFIPVGTPLEKFQGGLYLKGAAIIERYAAGNHEMSGFIQTLQVAGVEVVPILFAWAPPAGEVADEALKAIWADIKAGVEAAGPLDGLLVAPHGAGVSEVERDMDGWWLTELRKLVGEKLPLIITLDPHVNLSAKMMAAANAVLPYQTNPHLDQRQRGLKAGELMVRTLKGEIRPVARYCAPPMVINIEKQHTESGPVLALKKRCEELAKTPGILDIAIVLGFPYADVVEMGSGIVVVADGDEALAERTARQLGWELWEARESFTPDLLTPEEAVRLALEAPKPVLLLDMGDNVGGGSVGDGTWLAHLLYAARDTKSFISLLDPEAAQAAIAAGVGASVKLSIGGRSNPEFQSTPLEFEGEVVCIPPETYFEPKPRHGGKGNYNTGPAALLRSGEFYTLVTSRKMGTGSSRFFDNCGEDPYTWGVIVAKGVNAPLGAFEEICKTIIRVNTRGTTSADLSTFHYDHRTRPLYPYEEIELAGPEALSVV